MERPGKETHRKGLDGGVQGRDGVHPSPTGRRPSTGVYTVGLMKVKMKNEKKVKKEKKEITTVVTTVDTVDK